MLILALVLGLVFGLAAGRPASSSSNIDLTVNLGYAKYQGVNGKGGVSYWRGIRYAAAPVGDLRFRDPQDPVTQDIVQIASKSGPLCHQTPSESINLAHDEDCLFLDVYAPTEFKTAQPVFVWFQGGGFNTLSNPNADGTSLIQAGEHGMLVVTFNYRVGPWGFLASKEIQESGDLNVGLKDQRKVLEWVQNNIHHFGGDPKHVTIGGASAGGASVDLQLSAYGGRDDGLFHAGAAESQSFGAQLTVSESQYQYDNLVQRVGCSTAQDTLKCLRDTPIATLAYNNTNIPTPGGGGGTPVFMYSNVIDGNFTPDYTYNLYGEGKFVKVPVIFGDVTNEGTIFTTPKSSDTFQNYSDVNTFLLNNFVKLNKTDLAQIDHFYPKAEQFPDAGPYWRTAANAYGEMRYNCPGIAVSSSFPKFGVSQSYNYHWDYLTPANAANGNGVTHTAEGAYIWGTSTNALSPAIQGYWTSFIRSKDPNTYRAAGTPEWTTFNEDSMQRILFPNDASKVGMESVPADQRARCKFVTSIGAKIGQ